ncbi:MAG: ABC transporter ATP-binding protein [Ruminococcaceae bacterium]|nr:ABC transporter ATP-binding protein [Oscillospiraceae bacterium]
MIDVRNLTKCYREGDASLRALDRVSFRVGKGEFVAIIGSSGSGKSTLMNLLGCLDVPTDGEYRLDGVRVSGIPRAKLCAMRNRKIGFVFQGFHLIPRMTALENVELPMKYAGIPKEERVELARDALREVGLDSRMHHRPMQLSGGQQQRVAVARAIVLSPPLILADEPTGNLDRESSLAVMDLLRRQHTRGATVLVITHDREIASHAVRVLTIENGKLTSDNFNMG